MNRSEELAGAIEMSRALLVRFLPGFTDETHTAQFPGLPNHLAWNLGHLAHTCHRCAAMLDGLEAFPAADFVPGDAGNPERYAIESIAFGSVPVADPARYPRLARCSAIFDAAIARYAAAVRALEDPDRVVSWGGTPLTAAQLVIRMVFHNGTHCGEILDLRRALRLGRILG
ncbi:MAG: DinB family protein [Planctomycetota bacterium]|nr:DinB family protein [Planctomycetota bacterium]